MPSTDAAVDFLTTLNGLHPSLSFTMELPVDNKIPLIGMEIIKNGTKIETQVYRKPTNTGLLLHFKSHMDKRYKDCLLKTMIHRAYALSSTTEAFNQECTRLRSIFTQLDYPIMTINSTINKFIQNLSAGVHVKDKWKTAVSCELVSPSRTKHQLTRLEGKCVISVTRLALPYNQYLLARNWNKISSPKKSSLQS